MCQLAGGGLPVAWLAVVAADRGTGPGPGSPAGPRHYTPTASPAGSTPKRW